MERYNEFASSTGVAIPIIQRDYVQGAEVNFEKRDRFLESLFDALLKKEECKIDFIYGSSDNDSEPLFQPVDGQQRLTTLALIGWILNQKNAMRFSGKLKLLTYTTRPSTEQFCKELFNYQLPSNYGRISTHIKSVPGWFSERWLSDPSINAMLELLDKADSMLSEEPYRSNVERMADLFFNSNPIVFEKLDMEALNLNDDLYIKMNARGKLLTPFENWKAEFEGHLKKDFPNECYEYNSIPEDPEKPTLSQYFEYAIEHHWCDLFWPIAYERWNKLTAEERRKVTYPRIDEFFMNLLDYISRFLFFSSLRNAEEEAKKEEIKEVKMLYDREKDKSRMRVYGKVENIIKLFQIIDTLVLIKDKYKAFEPFFSLFFISETSNKRLNTTKVNLFNSDIDLVTLCFENKPQFTAEIMIMLWAVLEWLLQHPDCLEPNDQSLENMTDFLRVIMGWARGRRQRQTDKLSVRTNLRFSDYYAANKIITQLATSPDLFESLAGTQDTSLAAEREKGRFYGTLQYDIIRELSTCPELYYCFDLLMPSLSTATEAQSYINRFYEFISMEDEARIKELNARGFKGVRPMPKHYFYGAENMWDYVFTVGKEDEYNGYKEALDAITSWMNKEPRLTLTSDKMAYYIDKYPDFLKARYNYQSNGEPCHYFIRNNDFEVWAVKTYSTQPIRGYNVDPFGYTVEKLYKGPHKLFDYSNYSAPGLLIINENDMTMECCQKGWKISIIDSNSPAAKSFLSRFQETMDSSGKTIYDDSKGEFEFDETIIKDIEGKDRIASALCFLDAIS